MAEEPEKVEFSVRVSGREIYKAVKNLLVNEHKFTADKMPAMLMEHVAPMIKDWLNGQNMRTFVSTVARETVRGMAADMIKNEAKNFLREHVKVKAQEITIEVSDLISAEKAAKS